MSLDAPSTLAAETVQVIPPALPPSARWQPAVGEETFMLLDSLTLAVKDRQQVQDEAVSVLSKCAPPFGAPETSTGLVIGYVQSGKTMSFTTVAALARDNGYRAIIVITGTSVPLFGQSTDRLQKDLQIKTRQDRKWRFYENPSPRSEIRQSMEAALADWDDPLVPESERPTVLITVMKNHARLRDLIKLLVQLGLSDVPVLVIDDEADQAGMNTRVNQNEQSTTYRQLMDLRRQLPWHSYIQYTATPQAPLLISIIDALSPGFADILTPGANYVGGKDLFGDETGLVSTIPDGEIPGKGEKLAEPPDSLLDAMRVFILGVAAGLSTHGNKGNRSMLVHPSQQTASQSEYARVVSEVISHWRKLLTLGEGDPDREDLINDFETSYVELRDTVSDLPPFDQLAPHLRRAVSSTVVQEVNTRSGPTPQVNWKGAYSHILVGGQAMDRGFTVEGLTVTYMPRGVGVGNADTVQQRARFFGYKRPYLGYCRVFLETKARDAFRDYVEHEEDIRARLIQHGKTGKPLWEWRRAFFLTPALRPTRSNVLTLSYTRENYWDTWFSTRAPHASQDAVEYNRHVVDQFLASVQLVESEGHAGRTATQRHKVAACVPLRVVYEALLTQLRMTDPDDSQRLTGLLLQIDRYLEKEQKRDPRCVVYQMGPTDGSAGRRRGLDAEGRILNLFQGANPVDPPADRGKVYPGDREIRHKDSVTVQIHRLTITDPNGQVIAADVPALAVWMPKSAAGDWLVQEQLDVAL